MLAPVANRRGGNVEGIGVCWLRGRRLGFGFHWGRSHSEHPLWRLPALRRFACFGRSLFGIDSDPGSSGNHGSPSPDLGRSGRSAGRMGPTSTRAGCPSRSFAWTGVRVGVTPAERELGYRWSGPGDLDFTELRIGCTDLQRRRALKGSQIDPSPGTAASGGPGRGRSR